MIVAVETIPDCFIHTRTPLVYRFDLKMAGSQKYFLQGEPVRMLPDYIDRKDTTRRGKDSFFFVQEKLQIQQFFEAMRDAHSGELKKRYYDDALAALKAIADFDMDHHERVEANAWLDWAYGFLHRERRDRPTMRGAFPADEETFDGMVGRMRNHELSLAQLDELERLMQPIWDKARSNYKSFEEFNGDNVILSTWATESASYNETMDEIARERGMLEAEELRNRQADSGHGRTSFRYTAPGPDDDDLSALNSTDDELAKSVQLQQEYDAKALDAKALQAIAFERFKSDMGLDTEPRPKQRPRPKKHRGGAGDDVAQLAAQTVDDDDDEKERPAPRPGSFVEDIPMPLLPPSGRRSNPASRRNSVVVEDIPMPLLAAVAVADETPVLRLGRDRKKSPKPQPKPSPKPKPKPKPKADEQKAPEGKRTTVMSRWRLVATRDLTKTLVATDSEEEKKGIEAELVAREGKLQQTEIIPVKQMFGFRAAEVGRRVAAYARSLRRPGATHLEYDNLLQGYKLEERLAKIEARDMDPARIKKLHKYATPWALLVPSKKLNKRRNMDELIAPDKVPINAEFFDRNNRIGATPEKSRDELKALYGDTAAEVDKKYREFIKGYRGDVKDETYLDKLSELATWEAIVGAKEERKEEDHKDKQKIQTPTPDRASAEPMNAVDAKKEADSLSADTGGAYVDIIRYEHGWDEAVDALFEKAWASDAKYTESIQAKAMKYERLRPRVFGTPRPSIQPQTLEEKESTRAQLMRNLETLRPEATPLWFSTRAKYSETMSGPIQDQMNEQLSDTSGSGSKRMTVVARKTYNLFRDLQEPYFRRVVSAADEERKNPLMRFLADLEGTLKRCNVQRETVVTEEREQFAASTAVQMLFLPFDERTHFPVARHRESTASLVFGAGGDSKAAWEAIAKMYEFKAMPDDGSRTERFYISAHLFATMEIMKKDNTKSSVSEDLFSSIVWYILKANVDNTEVYGETPLRHMHKYGWHWLHTVNDAERNPNYSGSYQNELLNVQGAIMFLLSLASEPFRIAVRKNIKVVYPNDWPIRMGIRQDYVALVWFFADLVFWALHRHISTAKDEKDAPLSVANGPWSWLAFLALTRFRDVISDADVHTPPGELNGKHLPWTASNRLNEYAEDIGIDLDADVADVGFATRNHLQNDKAMLSFLLDRKFPRWTQVYGELYLKWRIGSLSHVGDRKKDLAKRLAKMPQRQGETTDKYLSRLEGVWAQQLYNLEDSRISGFASGDMAAPHPNRQSSDRARRLMCATYVAGDPSFDPAEYPLKAPPLDAKVVDAVPQAPFVELLRLVDTLFPEIAPKPLCEGDWLPGETILVFPAKRPDESLEQTKVRLKVITDTEVPKVKDRIYDRAESFYMIYSTAPLCIRNMCAPPLRMKVVKRAEPVAPKPAKAKGTPKGDGKPFVRKKRTKTTERKSAHDDSQVGSLSVQRDAPQSLAAYAAAAAADDDDFGGGEMSDAALAALAESTWSGSVGDAVNPAVAAELAAKHTKAKAAAASGGGGDSRGPRDRRRNRRLSLYDSDDDGEVAPIAVPIVVDTKDSKVSASGGGGYIDDFGGDDVPVVVPVVDASHAAMMVYFAERRARSVAQQPVVAPVVPIVDASRATMMAYFAERRARSMVQQPAAAPVAVVPIVDASRAAMMAYFAERRARSMAQQPVVDASVDARRAAMLAAFAAKR